MGANFEFRIGARLCDTKKNALFKHKFTYACQGFDPETDQQDREIGLEAGLEADREADQEPVPVAYRECEEALPFLAVVVQALEVACPG